jgi:hypothetical protein
MVRGWALGMIVFVAGALQLGDLHAVAQSDALDGPVPAPVQQPPAVPPDFALVRAAVGKYFASLADFQEGDLICQSQAAGALAAVKDVGWDVPGRDAILKQVLPDGSFLVKEFSTPVGRKFMRRVVQPAGAAEHDCRRRATDSRPHPAERRRQVD